MSKFELSANAAKAYQNSFPGNEKTFDSFREAAKTARKALTEQIAKDNARLKELEKVYTPTYLETTKKDMAAKRKAAKEKAIADLQNQLSELVNAKRTALEDYATAAPSAELVNLIQLYSLKSSISEAEFNALIRKAEGNFTAMSIIADMAARNNFELTMPIDINRASEDLDRAEMLCKDVLANIDADEKAFPYKAFEFFNYGKEVDGLISATFRNVDDSTAFATAPAEIPAPTLKERIDNRIEDLQKTGNLYDNARAEELKQFAEQHRGEILTEAEYKALLEERASEIAGAEI